jgi:hypothetical protein
MRDDASTVSAREWRAVREGEAHAAASKTSTNNTPESFLVGIGASGAVLAGAAIVFVTLVGLVSFNVWPTSRDTAVDANVELSQATKGATPNVSVSPAGGSSVQTTASTTGATGATAGAGNTGTGNTGGQQQGGSGGGGGGGGGNKGPKSSPPSTSPVTTPPTTDSGNSGSGNSDGSSGSGSDPVQAGKDPTHPVHPTHPDHPHQNVSTGSKETAGGDTDVTGKGPFARPTHGSSSSSGSGSSSASHGRGHGSSHSRH